jgi:hypothetical protein
MTDKNLVLASDGVIFEQGENKVEAEEIYFNLDNQNLKVRNGISYVKVEGAPELNNKIYYGGEEFLAQFPHLHKALSDKKICHPRKTDIPVRALFCDVSYSIPPTRDT